MIKSFKNIDQVTAQKILTSITMDLLPSANSESPSFYDEISKELKTKVIDEIYLNLKINRNDIKESDKSKIFEFLAKEMTSNFIDDKKSKLIKSRIGQKGDLSPWLYTINFSDSFNVLSEKIGIRRSHVEDVVRNPDSYQHLFPNEESGDEIPALSLYVKYIKNVKNPFILLVEAKREGDIQNIFQAWRVYLDDVDTNPFSKPLDVLRSFVSCYGIPLKIGNSEYEKFFFYQSMQVDKSISTVKIFEMQIQITDFISSLLIRRPSPELVEIAIAYIIDYKKYSSDLEKYGVTTKK